MLGCFNAARGFVGGAAGRKWGFKWKHLEFQCRTRLCGWCSLKDVRPADVDFDVSMPHAALWVVQHSSANIPKTLLRRFNAARGFVGGAAAGIAYLLFALSSFNAARGFVGGAALSFFWIRKGDFQFQCRTRLCGWCSKTVFEPSTRSMTFQCRTRLCGWCSEESFWNFAEYRLGFNAARGFVGGAALNWIKTRLLGWRFNAARGFVGGAACPLLTHGSRNWGFQCRTRLCGWCSSSGGKMYFHLWSFNAARGFVGGAAKIEIRRVLIATLVSMPHAALWVVQQLTNTVVTGSNNVSMPHAALWVVQPCCFE